MKTIHKYHIDRDIVQLPVGAKIIHVGVQRDELFAWAIVDPAEKTMEDAIVCVGTGHPMPDYHPSYHSTHMLVGGAVILHVFIPKQFLI